jgi:SEL1 protein
MTVKAINALARGESEPEILEYLKYNSDRGQMRYTWRLGHHYYAGSVFPHGAGGVSSGAEEIGEIPQSFDEARKYFHKVARLMWPVDFESDGKAGQRRAMSEERKKELNDPAMVAAAFLGRMYMRGEGVKQDFKLARLWYERSANLGDRESHNGLGILYRDGLGVKKDMEKAFKYFQAAAGLDLPDAEINIGKMLLAKGDGRASNYFVHAVQHGSPFEAFYHLATLHSASAHAPIEDRAPGACGVAVGYYKLVSEVGAWDDDYIGEANRAWGRGEEDKALLGWWIAAEMGSEIGQNNVAFMLNRGSTHFGHAIPADTELMLWTRSAAQGNADAMVMVGDSYCELKRPLPS